MLRLKACFLILASVLSTPLTKTPEQTTNLNPSLSDDGRVVIFESSANFFSAVESSSFHAIRADVFGDPPTFLQLGSTRIVSPALSSDASKVVFASAEDLIGQNPDRNSEIFMFSGSTLKQITHTQPSSSLSRLDEGNFHPSITSDGRLIAFSSHRGLFLFDVGTGVFSELTHSEIALNPKISGDGSRIYYQRGSDLVLLDLKTRIARIVVTDVLKLSLTTGRAISNDGMRLVYSAEPAANQSQVFLYDAGDNRLRQLTQLGSRSTDVNLQPTISGDGKRVAFATRRRVTNASDGSVELYVYDIPSGQTQQITNAPARGTAEVVSSLNFDGSLVAFSFPRVLSGPVTDDDLGNNSEIYLASIPPRPAFGAAKILNAAAQGKEPEQPAPIAPGSIASIRGSALAFKAETAVFAGNGPPLVVAGTNVKVNGHAAPIFYAAPDEVVFVVPDVLADGPADFVVTNSDGFSSKAEGIISSAAPGIFTVGGDGQGEAIVLESDTHMSGPFDPSNGRLRLSIFATGVARASDVSVSINGQSAKVEAVARAGLPGLDEIQIQVPAELRGAQKSTLIVTAGGTQSNPVSIDIGGSSLRDVVINEILADPPDGAAGDANHDGVRDTADDEFVELVNSTARDLDLSGYQLQTRSLTGTTDIVRHRFPPGTTLSAGSAIVIFGGGKPEAGNPVFGGSQVFKASTSGLSLVNSGGVVTLRNAAGETVTSITYGSALGLRADLNQSLTRAPDVTGNLSLHATASGSEGRNFSPGTNVDGSAFIRVTFNFVHALSHRCNHVTSRALWLRQLPRRPT